MKDKLRLGKWRWRVRKEVKATRERTAACNLPYDFARVERVLALTRPYRRHSISEFAAISFAQSCAP